MELEREREEGSKGEGTEGFMVGGNVGREVEDGRD